MSRDDALYQAMLARDNRFDGKFFVGVKTTGVYCRPICPARPKRENVEFFASAASAERAGYRPCLRCRPECAPQSPAWYGTSAVVQRALRVIAASGRCDGNEEEFAAQFGVSGRHLRRLFEREIGRSPKQIADIARLGFARKLVVETRMPLTTVALSAGFGSLRRFNDAFRQRFRRPPSQLRRSRLAPLQDGGFELRLAYRPPLDWGTLHRFYASHQIRGVETIGHDWYERVFRIGKSVGVLKVSPDAEAHQLRLRVWVEDPTVLFEVVGRVRRMFDLDCDPVLVANSLGQSPLLGRLCEQHPGLRLPRGWDAFEMAVCIILGQLVSTERASQMVGQLVEHYGERIAHPLSGAAVRLFPEAAALAACDLSAVGTTSSRRRAIRELSQRVCSGVLRLTDAQDAEAFRAAVLEITGIGPWSAHYMSLRAIGDTDAFPATDLVLRRVLQQHPGLDLDCIKPWRSYAAIYLWKAYAHKLSRKKEKAQDALLL